MYDYRKQRTFEGGDLKRPIPEVIMKRFLEILSNPPLIEVEINSWKEGEVEDYLKSTKDRSERTAQRIASKEGMEYEEVLDSLIKQGIARTEEYALRYMEDKLIRKTDVFVVEAGFERIYEAIPMLEKDLKDSINYNPNKCLMSLAPASPHRKV